MIHGTDGLAIGFGSVVGFILGLVGGGGSILAVPFLVYGVGVASPHVAIGTGTVAVAVSAFANLFPHWRAGRVKWRCGAVFAAAGVLGALAGSELAKAVDGERLLMLFGALMVAVGFVMLRRRGAAGDPDIRLQASTAWRLLPRLIAAGFGVGALSGFFGIGGGFLIVPGLMLATGMPLPFAIGTSLVAVSAFGAATASSYAASGLVDWRLALVFILGGLAGGLGGAAIGGKLANRKALLGRIFAGVVITVGLYVLLRGFLA
ncbi:sulfite exporter TauE/SafE family protein [Kaistia sp. MMO-174]|uniref:sulfite exporter TauE/SafE family protein n=1 Tax=Kaistia sp. MMO-174 TaxID=3081256 RepID=UPI001AC51243|nr:sulfite exporter TauE/SafE family protein [Hyphomicrobiales bacterium]